MTISYISGASADATKPLGAGNKIITHICNDIGVWGAGFVMALSKRWREPEAAYLEASKKGLMTLGKVQLVRVAPDIQVANMVAQHLVGQDENGEPCIRYDALITCLRKLSRAISSFKGSYSVHAPRMGAGLAGGNWRIIEPIIETELCDKGIEVTVYDWKG
jgi:O-acetyl-ADP-ribose deacetylase (regulator of RNase III)